MLRRWCLLIGLCKPYAKQVLMHQRGADGEVYSRKMAQGGEPGRRNGLNDEKISMGRPGVLATCGASH